MTIVGVDLAKNILQIRGVQRTEKGDAAQAVSPRAARGVFREASCLIGIEACGGIHHEARVAFEFTASTVLPVVFVCRRWSDGVGGLGPVGRSALERAQNQGIQESVRGTLQTAVRTKVLATGESPSCPGFVAVRA